MNPGAALNRCRALLGVAILLVASGIASAAEFSADVTEKMGTTTMTGKMYVKGLMIRHDTVQGPRQGSAILRMDKKVVWILDPAQKTYMEMPTGGKELAYLSPDDVKATQALKKVATVKKLGRETVNGYPCDKYLLTYKDKSLGTQYQWVSQRLKVPIKVEQKGPKLEMLMEYRNIKEGRVPDSLFQIPAGYKKVSMPAMQRGRMPKAPARSR